MLWEYDKRDDVIREVLVKDAGVIDDVYTVELPEGPDRSIDDVFGQIENRAAPTLAQLASATLGALVLPDTDRWSVALYMALLNRRVPAATAAFHEQIEALRRLWTLDRLRDRDQFHSTWSAGGWGSDPEEAERTRLEWSGLLESGASRFVTDRKIGLTGIGGAPDEALHIALGTWTVLKRTRHPLFLIGDAPVKSLSPRPQEAPILTFTSRSTRWHMPLTPSAALVVRPQRPGDTDAVVDADGPDPTLDAEWSAVLPDPVVSDAALVHDLIQWRYAERWVWGPDRDDVERVGQGFAEPDRRASASELHRTSGWVRAGDPAHMRAILDEVARRRAAGGGGSG